MTQFPSPNQLAKIIAISSFSNTEKQQIIDNLKYLSSEKIILLYERLIKLHEEETRFVNEVDRIDLKYKIKLEEEIERAKTVRSEA